MLRRIEKPAEGEYAAYAIMYIGLLPDDDLVLNHLRNNFLLLKERIFEVPEPQLTVRCAPDEWTIKEILVHIVDDERIYAYRALRFARNDPTELPGFDQDHYTAHSAANARPLASIFAEYEAVRQSTITMFASFDDEALLRSGIANGHRMSVRAAAYHIAGHELHHLNSMHDNYGV
jgi:uncharacterized damage-inducible protein DinB